MKYCYKCKITYELGSFSKNPRKKDGLNTLCKECYKTYQREWYAKNKYKHKKATSERKVKAKKRIQEWIMEYLSTHPCVDCGERHPWVLEFDHVRGQKTCAIGKLVGEGAPIWKVEKEATKCEIRCCNCHRKATITRDKRNWKNARSHDLLLIFFP